MSVIHLENEDFNNLIANKKVVVDFFATWCGPCKMFGPIFEKTAEKSDITFIKVDTDKHPHIAKEYGIMSIPTILLLDNGKVINKHIGFLNEIELENFIK